MTNKLTRLKIIVRDVEKSLRLFVRVFFNFCIIDSNFIKLDGDEFPNKYYITFSKNILIIWFHQNGFLEKSCSLPQSL
jgi:hypothetical protein